jgi:GPH family glycoside/pentoside/hexuronide:cation symporter
MGIAGMGFSLLGVPTFAFIAGREGKKRALLAVFSASIAIFVASWWLYNPAIPWLQIFASGLIAFVQSAFWMLDGSIMADVIDYDELSSGKRREGIFQAFASWSVKVGLALGGGLAGILLARTGFDAKLGGAQTEQALTMIRLLFAAIPITGIAVAIVILLRYPLTQEVMAGIRGELESRRGKV